MRPPAPILCAAAVAFVSCDEPPTTTTKLSDLPTITVAVGAAVAQVPFTQTSCAAEGATTRVELTYPGEVPDGRNTRQTPRVLIARLEGERVLEAHAFVPQARFFETEYPMLHVVGGPLAPNSECRIDREGPRTTLVCNHAQVVPWLDPGPRPEPSFKVTFSCPP